MNFKLTAVFSFGMVRRKEKGLEGRGRRGGSGGGKGGGHEREENEGEREGEGKEGEKEEEKKTHESFSPSLQTFMIFFWSASCRLYW